MLAAIMICNNLRILPLTLKLSKVAHPISSSHDGEEIPLVAGDWVKISPLANRQFFAEFFADANSPISYVCIQVKENSLDTYTMTDAGIVRA